MSPAPQPVLRLQDIPARDRGGGIRTIPLVTRRTGSTGFINGYTIFPPLGAVQLHSHNCDECVVLLEGRAIAWIDGVEHALQPGDATFLLPGVPHFFRNVSETEDMRILWIYASIDADRKILATGETRRIDDEHQAAPWRRAMVCRPGLTPRPPASGSRSD